MKFQVFKDGKTIKEFSLIGVTLFGLDRIPFRSSKNITFKDGVIECNTKTAEPAGLSLLWPIEGFGNVILYTTRLPEREQPYILNVELARAKLMEITIKREDWSIFEEEENIGNQVAEIQKLFIQTLDNINNPAKASMLADKCLIKAMKFSEQLAAKNAEILFNVRHQNRNFTRSSIGCTINPGQLENADYLKATFDIFAHVSIPVSWSKIEAVKGEYDFNELDRCVEILSKKRMLFCVGPLLCFNEQALPGWLKGYEDFEAIREASYEFVSKIVTRYAKYIHIWLVIGGLNAYNYFKFSFERILDIKSLVIYGLYALGKISKDSWQEGFDGIENFAKSFGCQRVIAFTNDKLVNKLAGKFGFNRDFFLTREV